MKKKKIYLILGIFIFTGLAVLLGYKINCFFKYMYPPYNSSSTLESKKKGLLINYFSVQPDFFSLPNGDTIKISEIWAEKKFKYLNECSDDIEISQSIDDYHLIISLNITRDSLKTICYLWDVVKISEPEYSSGGLYSNNNLGNEMLVKNSTVFNSIDTLKLVLYKDLKEVLFAKKFVIKSVGT